MHSDDYETTPLLPRALMNAVASPLQPASSLLSITTSIFPSFSSMALGYATLFSVTNVLTYIISIIPAIEYDTHVCR